MTIQNKLADPFAVGFGPNIKGSAAADISVVNNLSPWRALPAEDSRTYSTNSSDAKAILCFGAPAHPRSVCDHPHLIIKMDNPFAGRPRISIGSFLGTPALDSTFRQGQSKSVSTTVGSQELVISVTRGADSPLGHQHEDYKINWTVAISPAG
jgi:hypothetical protein